MQTSRCAQNAIKSHCSSRNMVVAILRECNWMQLKIQCVEVYMVKSGSCFPFPGWMITGELLQTTVLLRVPGTAAYLAGGLQQILLLQMSLQSQESCFPFSCRNGDAKVTLESFTIVSGVGIWHAPLNTKVGLQVDSMHSSILLYMH